MLEEREQVQGLEALPARAASPASSRIIPIAVAALPLVLIVATAFTVTAIFTRSIHTFSIMPDELGYVKQSIEIWKHGPPVGRHDFWFNSWAQLLPLVSAPLFGGLGMVQAYYTAHTLYAFLLASTAIPAYLLARELRLGRLAASLVAALSVAVPWMVLAGLVMTEVVAYPVFTWAVLAIVRALDAPSARRDFLAIAAVALAFFARTQFLVLGPILVVATLLHDVGPAVAAARPRAIGAAVVSALRRTLAAHRVLWVFTGLGLIVVVGLMVTGSLESVLGSYITPVSGTLVPPGAFTAGFKELDGVTLGIGIVPLILAVTWALVSAVRPRDPARHAFAVVLLVCLPVFLWMVGSFDVRFLGGNTTDRYMFYFAPLLFTGAAAWVVDRRGSLVPLAAVCASVIWMVVTVELHASSADIIDPSFAIHHAFVTDGHALTHTLGLPDVDPRILLAVIATTFVLLLVALQRRLLTLYLLLALAVPLLAYGVANTGYVMTKLSQQYSSIPASHPEAVASIDREVPGSANVGLVIAPADPSGAQLPVNTWYTWWQPSFWDKTVQRAFAFPGDDTFAQGFVTTLYQDLAHGRLTGLEGADYLVKINTDARFAPRGRVLSPVGAQLILYQLVPGAQLLYGTSGVDQYSRLEPRSHPFIRIFGSGAAATSERVTVTLQTPAARAECPCRIHFGSGYGDAALPAASLTPGHAVPVIRVARVPSRGYAQLNLTVTGRDGQPVPWVTLVSVRIKNATP
jgi:hypothetical protein